MAKKLLLVSLAFFFGSLTFLWADLTFAAIAVDSSGASIASGGTFSTTAADTIVIFSYEANTATPQTISCTNGCGTATIIGTPTQNGSTYLQSFWIHVSASGSHTATLPNLAGNGQFISYTGADTSPIGQVSQGSNGTSLSLSGVATGSWVVCHWDGTGTNLNLSGTPCVFRVGSAGGQGMADSNMTVAGSLTQNWSGAGTNGAEFFEIKILGGGGGGGGAATTTPYYATKQEYLFVILVFTFLASIPFWERVLTLRRDKYRI